MRFGVGAPAESGRGEPFVDLAAPGPARPRLVEALAGVTPLPSSRLAPPTIVELNATFQGVHVRRPPRDPEEPAEDLNTVMARVARTRISVLVTGETGSGKEVVARRLHDASPRAAKPFICVNCAAVCETLIESELFGFQRGAFTGAEHSKVGLIEAADGGTLFLDEVGELSLSAQAKFLRVIETRTVLPVGATRPRPVDVRFIAATNVDLEAAVAHGRFREDLFFRLEGYRLRIPPLRARVAEILPAARKFLAEFSASEGIATPVLTSGAELALQRHRWKGNFRELRNVIERATILCTNGSIQAGDLRLTGSEDLAVVPAESGEPAAPRSERERILEALKLCAGNQTRAARLLGISRRTLITRLDSLGIARPRARPLRAVGGERTCG
ncbi:MAG TPA: sigma-54 dependent transcriptional regulator [Polyangia bacterium]